MSIEAFEADLKNNLYKVWNRMSSGTYLPVLTALRERMSEVGLRLHPEKTRIAYCRDGKRRACYEHTAFTFLGYTFRPAGCG